MTSTSQSVTLQDPERSRPSLTRSWSYPVLRTYALSLALALGPAFIPSISSFPPRATRGAVTLDKGQTRPGLIYLLKRELGPNGFAFAFTVVGVALLHIWEAMADLSGSGKVVNDTPRDRSHSPSSGSFRVSVENG